MNDAAGEHRKIAAPAMSSGIPQRPKGVRDRIASLRAGSSCNAWVKGVVIQPGGVLDPVARTLARILRRGGRRSGDGDARVELGECVADCRADTARPARYQRDLVAKQVFLVRGCDHVATFSSRSAMTSAWRGSGATAP